MSQDVSIDAASPFPVHSIYQHSEPNDVNFIGYAAQLQKDSGFDAILAGTAAGKAAPVFALERRGSKLSVPTNRGCAWVAAGGFKNCIPLISIFACDCLKINAGGISLDDFTKNSIQLINDMKMASSQKLVPTLESCDDPRYSPVDITSPDSPVEFILFA